MRLFFDIETNGFLRANEKGGELTKVWCIVVKCADTGATQRFGPEDLEAGVLLLGLVDELIGHNIQGYDIPALKKIYPWFTPNAKVTDTLVLSRLRFPEMQPIGFEKVDYATGQVVLNKAGRPEREYDTHGLRAWGVRLGVLKGDYGIKHGFLEFHPDMVDYCAQDVEVTEALYRHLEKAGIAVPAAEIEHRFAAALDGMMARGAPFNKARAQGLLDDLQVQQAELVGKVAASIPPWEEVVELKTPEYWRAPDSAVYRVKKDAPPKVRALLVAGPPKTKTVVTPFNPSSRQHIARFLKERYGWEPQHFTPSGEPELSEEVMESLPYAEAKDFTRLFAIEKRIAAINGLLEAESEGRVRGWINHNGTPTARCKHSRPNLGNQTSLRKWLGKEIRSLFISSEGRQLVGCDAERGELVMLAHYLALWDKGSYAKVVAEGDVHSTNQRAFGVDTRDQAKTAIYCLVYGGGPSKLGSVVGLKPGEQDRLLRDHKSLATRFKKQLERSSQVGAEAVATAIKGHLTKASFIRKTPGFQELIDAVQAAAGRGYLIGLDNRQLPIRHKHAALNTLLQGALAVTMKVATNLAVERMADYGDLILHVHDEYVFDCWEPEAGVEILPMCIGDAGKELGLKCPLFGKAQVGADWSEVH